MVSIPEDILEIMKKIAETNPVYLVGGFVRDNIIGRYTVDYNLCTNMSFDRLLQLFPDMKIEENDNINIGFLRKNNLDIEITQMRGNTLEEDLSKRDFTMNALACDKDGNIVDYFGGKDDLINRQIDLVQKDGSGIEDNPLRILRALRFEGTHGFTLDPVTKEIINKKSYLLKSYYPDRVYSEFKRIICLDNPTNIIRENKEVFCSIVPGLRETIGFDQKNPHHIYDVFEHTLKVIENTPADTIDGKVLRLTALFHDIGKPRTFTQDENGIGHFYGHPEVSNKAFEAFANYFQISKGTFKKVSKLIKYHDKELSLKPMKMKRFLMEFGTEDLNLLFIIKEADMKAQNPELLEERLKKLEETKKAYFDMISSGICLSIKDLEINDDVLKDMGVEGEKIKFVLDDVLDKVTKEELVNDRNQIVDYINNNHIK